LSHTSSPFCSGYFGDGVSPTICLGCPWTLILPISASQLTRITSLTFFNCNFNVWLILCFQRAEVDKKHGDI
jgi:hypothetical protein